jgi:hypothetical protein
MRYKNKLPHIVLIGNEVVYLFKLYNAQFAMDVAVLGIHLLTKSITIVKAYIHEDGCLLGCSTM